MKFITFVVARPVVVSGLSSGGVISAWLSACAPPGMIRGAHYEDPPLFSCEINPAFGPSLRQSIGAIFELYSTYLGNQWCIGDVEGMLSAATETLPPIMAQGLKASFLEGTKPPQNLKEYDPEWAEAFLTGSVGGIHGPTG